jgi:hypothetical protein
VPIDGTLGGPPPGQIVDLVGPDHGYQGRSSPRRMERAGQVHRGDGRRDRERRRHPGILLEEHPGADSDDGRDQVPANEVPRLRQWTSRRAVEKHRRCAERADHERQVGARVIELIRPGNGYNAEKSADPGPKDLAVAHPRRATTGAAPHLAQVGAEPHNSSSK